jgi:hypothetical protein
MFTKITEGIIKIIDNVAAALSTDLIITGILGCAVLIGLIQLLIVCFKFKKTYIAITEKNASITYLKEVLTKRPTGLVRFFAVLIFWLSAMLLASLYSKGSAPINSLTAIMLILSAYLLIYGLFALLSKLILKAKYKKINMLYEKYAGATENAVLQNTPVLSDGLTKASKTAARAETAVETIAVGTENAHETIAVGETEAKTIESEFKLDGYRAEQEHPAVSVVAFEQKEEEIIAEDEAFERIFETTAEDKAVERVFKATITEETNEQTTSEDTETEEIIEETEADETWITEETNEARRNETEELELGAYEPYILLRQPHSEPRSEADTTATPAAPRYLVQKAASYVTPSPRGTTAGDINNLNGLDTSDDIIARIKQIKAEGASIQTMQSIALLIQREREKKENKTLEQQRRMNEALSDLLKTMSRYR